MTPGYIHQSLSSSGTFEFLRALDYQVDAMEQDKILGMMSDYGIDNPRSSLEDLITANVLQRLGVRFALSTFGLRTLVLLEALNGGDLRLAYQRLSSLDGALHQYELVREGMTALFLEDINARPDFSRLYICSPWIGLDERNRDLLTHAIQSAEARGESPEILVLTRPASQGRAPEGIAPLRDLGANIFLNAKLHTKLYIREPGKRGGYAVAIVGSQNLTRSGYLELGIRINSDSTTIGKLVNYFWEITSNSKELRREERSGNVS